MINGVVLTMLSIESIADIRSRSVSVLRQAIFWVFAVIFNIVFYYQTLSSVLGGMALGIFLLLVAYVTREGIGYGDGLVLCSLAAYGTLTVIGKTFCVALLGIGMTALIAFVLFRKGPKTEIPFVPFLFLGYGWSLFR